MNSIKFTGHDPWIDSALKSLWPPFVELCKDVKKFEPQPLSSFEDLRLRLEEKRSQLNPSMSNDEIAAHVDRSISHRADPDIQKHDAFRDRIVNTYVQSALLALAFTEAIINRILATGLASQGKEALFQMIENSSVVQKWCVGPKCFCPSFELPKSRALYTTLERLVHQRNALVHHKGRIEIDGEEIYSQGPFRTFETIDEGLRWIRRYFSLPYDLEEHATRVLPSTIVTSVSMEREPIPIAHEHRAAIGKLGS